MKYLISAILFLFVFQGCLENPLKRKAKPRPAEGKPLTETSFNSEKIGWKINLPKGKEWKIISNTEQARLDKKGRDMIEESTGTEIPKSNAQDLISFRKDQYNSFISNIERFNEAVDGDYDDMLTVMHQVIKNTYAAKYIPAEYELSATRIDGVMVDRFDIKLYSPNKKVILTQHVFTCLVKDHILSIHISADNKTDDEILEKIVFSSDFY